MYFSHMSELESNFLTSFIALEGTSVCVIKKRLILMACVGFTSECIGFSHNLQRVVLRSDVISPGMFNSIAYWCPVGGTCKC